jgi:hypothetical protein
MTLFMVAFRFHLETPPTPVVGLGPWAAGLGGAAGVGGAWGAVGAVVGAGGAAGGSSAEAVAGAYTRPPFYSIRAVFVSETQQLLPQKCLH